MIATASLVSCTAASSYELSAAEATQALNLQRETNGIPAGIADRLAWDEGCAAHLNWLRLNPSAYESNPHIETPGTPGYSEAGAWAGEHAGLLGQLALSSTGTAWYDGFEEAPYHLFPLLAPSLTEIGYVPNCIVDTGGPARPVPLTPQILTYPGNGTNFIEAWEKAEESPHTPAPLAGLPENRITGPYLVVYAWGAGTGELTGATLRGPAGPVEVRTVSAEEGGFVIPPAPLTVGATYTATATYTPASVADGGSSAPPIDHEWSFTVARPGRLVEGLVIGTKPLPVVSGTPLPTSHPKPVFSSPVVVRIVRVALNRRFGTAVLYIRLSSAEPGTVTLTGRGIKTVRKWIPRSAAIKMSVTPTPILTRRLRHNGKATVRVQLAVAQGAPSGTSTRTVLLTLRH